MPKACHGADAQRRIPRSCLPFLLAGLCQAFPKQSSARDLHTLSCFQIPYIGKAALIANKKSAGRHKDLADVEELERLVER